MKKGRFLGACLLLFALLLGAWKGTQSGRWYTDGVLASAAIVGPMLHGWVLETRADEAGPVWVHGGNRVKLSLQFDALAVGVVPLLALLAATPGLPLRRRATVMCVGVGLNFLADVLIVALFPVLVFYKNPFTDVVGTFLGLIAFVGAPVIIWFALTFRELQQSLPSLRPDARTR